jgi:hypothetical protein
MGRRECGFLLVTSKKFKMKFKLTDRHRWIIILAVWIPSGIFTIGATAQAIRHHCDSTIVNVDSLKINGYADPALIRKFIEEARQIAVLRGIDTSKLYLEGLSFGSGDYSMTSPQPGAGRIYWIYVTGYGPNSWYQSPQLLPLFIPDSTIKYFPKLPK